MRDLRLRESSTPGTQPQVSLVPKSELFHPIVFSTVCLGAMLIGPSEYRETRVSQGKHSLKT